MNDDSVSVIAMVVFEFVSFFFFLFYNNKINIVYNNALDNYLDCQLV